MNGTKDKVKLLLAIAVLAISFFAVAGTCDNDTDSDASAAANEVIRYVSSNGNDSNDGSKSNPYQHLILSSPHTRDL